MARSDAILERLLRLHPKKIDLSLGRVLALLDRLDRPQDRLAPVIHVAGTNGKGSTVAFLRAMLEAAGYRVHVYTSPHLVRFHERIRLAGRLIDEADLVDLLEECERANGGAAITYFEITTAAAFKAFAETPADIVLLEVGLGGRYDATTVVDRPAATAIAPVSMDHMQFLGDTLTEIAGEKAAIQKPGVVSAVGPQDPVALRVIEATAGAVGAPLFRFGTEWRTEMRVDGMRYEAAGVVRELPAPSLLGPHQAANAGLAIACLDNLDGFAVPDAAIAEGLRTVDWPARIQRLTAGRLAALLPAGWELWLDGGHNPAAGEMLAAVATGWRDRPLHLVFGMLNSKAPEDFLRPLARYVASLRAVAIPGEEASLTAADCAEAARTAGIGTVGTSPGIADALRAVAQTESRPSRVMICGSLYLAGHVLAENESAL